MKKILLSMVLIIIFSLELPAANISWDDKVSCDSPPCTEDNEKISAADMNDIKDTVNANPELVISNSAADPTVNDDVNGSPTAATPDVAGYNVGDFFLNDTDDPFKLWQCVDNTNAAAEWVMILTADSSGVVSLSSINMGSGTLESPNSTDDLTLSNAGEHGFQVTDDQFCAHWGATGEINGEACLSGLEHFTIQFNPEWYYDNITAGGANGVPLFKIGRESPEGIIIVAWALEYVNGDPTTELDADFRYADDWAGTNASDIDEIDSTSGSSSEDAPGEINGGAAISNGKYLYVGFDADPADSGEIIYFEFWYYNEED